MTAKKNREGIWVFYNEIKGLYYYYSDIYGRLNGLEEAIRADIGIFLWKLTGNINHMPKNIREEIIFQDEAYESYLHGYGECIPIEWIYAQVGYKLSQIYK